MAEFVDRVVLHLAAGNGGNGCSSVHREKFKPLGGPDGANGGRGGDVVLDVDASTASLLDYHRRPHRRAGNGRPGRDVYRACTCSRTVRRGRGRPVLPGCCWPARCSPSPGMSCSGPVGTG